MQGLSGLWKESWVDGSDVSRTDGPEFQHTLAGQMGAMYDVKASANPVFADSRDRRTYDEHRCGVWYGSHPDFPGKSDGGLLKFIVLPDITTKNISCSSPGSAGV